MAWYHGGISCPKPEKGSGKQARKRTKASLGREFRDRVWDRASDAQGDAYCERCGRLVLRTLDVLDMNAGHVAHRRGRNVAPEDKYNPDAALLLCRPCHLGGDHGMRFR